MLIINFHLSKKQEKKINKNIHGNHSHNLYLIFLALKFENKLHFIITCVLFTFDNIADYIE